MVITAIAHMCDEEWVAAADKQSNRRAVHARDINYVYRRKCFVSIKPMA